MSSLSLTNIVNVTVQVSPATPSPTALNVGLIVGSSTIISKTTRTVAYANTAAMLTGGWTGTEPEYKAAQVYFSQTPTPTSVVIGHQDTASSESILTAVQACRASNNTWYGVYACGAVDADILAVAGYIQTATPNSTYFYDTSDSAVLNGTAGNVMATCQSNKYSRTFGMYSTSQYAGAGALGEAMGLNTGLANSSFTMAYKSLVGVTPEVLTGPQATTITGYNGNIYTTYGPNYNLLVQGTMADGTPFDQILNLDILTANIQTAVMNALTSVTKIPQTDGGVSILVNDIAEVCAQAATQGILAPGVWNAAPVLGLQTGTNLPNGYLVLADKIANQTAAQISARQAPNIYACVKMAGAIEHVTIGIFVSQ